MTCRVCAAHCDLYDVVDFNKSCEEARGTFLGLSGKPIYYVRCSACGFCSAPEIASWSPDQFHREIYNADYIKVDPDHEIDRPKDGARKLLKNFAKIGKSLQHLDYGGGKGELSQILRENGWNSTSHDPFYKPGEDFESIGQYDLITAFEVFEHVPDPRDLMKRLQKLLAPGGAIYFTTQVSDGSIVENGRLTWWYAAPRNGHISLFTKNSLQRLGLDFGFSLLSIDDGSHLYFKELPTWSSKVRKWPRAKRFSLFGGFNR